MTMFTRSHVQRAFTLFEVAISLALVAISITAVIMVLPKALQSQQIARYKMFACTAAMQVMDTYAKLPSNYIRIDTEAANFWDTSSGRRNYDPDIEIRASAAAGGMAPVPLSIARRIDSDQDEIGKLLDAGGYIYYMKPSAVGIRNQNTINDQSGNVPSEMRRLVMGVVGPAQQNAMTVLPMKAWPYYAAFPSPPMHGLGYTAADCSNAAGDGVDTDAQRVFSTRYPLSKKITDSSGNISWEPERYNLSLGAKGYWEAIERYVPTIYLFSQKNLTPPVDLGYVAWRTPTQQAVKDYAALALWYALQKGLDRSFYDFTSGAQGEERTDFVPGVPRHFQVNAMRFIAHSMIMLTRVYTKAELDSGTVIITPDGGAGAPVTLNHEKILRWHESCLNLATKFASEDPYDFGAPRPLNRAIMMDQPLMEFDFFANGANPSYNQSVFPQPQMLSGNITGSDSCNGGTPVNAWQWRPITAQPVQHFGVSFTNTNYSSATDPATMWGDRDHFSLTAPFDPTHRDRQLVFWAVDWQSYEDAETAPSAPVDASRYACSSPEPKSDLSKWALSPSATYLGGMNDLQSRLSYARIGGWGADNKGLPFSAFYTPISRNPEYPFTFILDVSSGYWGNDIRDQTCYSGTGQGGHYADMRITTPWGGTRDFPVSLPTFRGLYGADRNGDGKLNQGPAPRSARLKALTVVRFNVYDQRVHSTVR